jgi:surface polysaccharide O-acyltransferase-like enzyme
VEEYMSERRWNLDVIRIFACVLVIAIHVTGYGLEVQTVMSMDWISRVVITSLSRCAVPVFFMLSGILFMKKEISLKTLYRKYILHIFLAWLTWSTVYAMIDYIAAYKKGNASAEYLLARIAAGHYHLWFIPALLIAYIFLPFLQKLMKSCSEIEIKYLGIIILVAVVGKETLSPFLSGSIWDGIWDNFSVPGASVGIIYFVLGYYLEKKKDFITYKISWGLLLIGGIGAVLKNICCGAYTGDPELISYSYLSLDYFLYSIGIFLLGIKMDYKIKVSPKVSQILGYISSYTFGIYLVHAVFIEQVYRRIGLFASNFPVWISPLFFTIVTFGLSFAVVWVIKKIPVLNRYIV